MGVVSGKNSGATDSVWIRVATLGLIITIALQVVSCESEPTESQCRLHIEKALKQQHAEDLEKTDAELPTSIKQDESDPIDYLTETIEDTLQEVEVPEAEESPAEGENVEGESSETKEDLIEETKKVETNDEEYKEPKEGENEEINEITHEEEISDETSEKKEEGEEQAEEEDNGAGEDEDLIENESALPEASDEQEEKEFEREEKIGKETGEIIDEAPQYDGEAKVEQNNTEDDLVKETLEVGHTEEEAQAKNEEILESQIEYPETLEEPEVDNILKEEDAEQDADATEESSDDETGSDPDAEEKAEAVEDGQNESSKSEEDEREATPEEDLTKEVTIPEYRRPRDHITNILRLDEDSVETESVLSKAVDSTLKNLKGLYETAIKPLEMLYKYRDLSNRHFGDPEIFSKPLVLFMGPWSGGKSSTINYLLDNEFTEMSLRTGAEPSPAYFNILMFGNEEEILDGTQLAADWTFSGLQKFGQSLLDRLKGYKLPNRLLEKVNIVEIPGILEIRKQVQRLFPFNDACQWFIDRADIIFLVYDPSKLDVGPETEAILDQLKGREYQTRIILNKADQVKPEELMRVQGTLIWNISPLMSSSEPPIMYSTSLWSLPYENGAPTRLLLAQERAFLRDLRDAIDKRVENKIASARRFAVRVRNHAKMVDCYLTTYYNHKTFFGNRKKISDDIIENPQKYHIYEGLSTLTNISRYDLPDPDVYKDFFKLNPLYDFKKLSDTCTYFRGCPINTLDVAIAYDLPELIGKYKKGIEATKVLKSHKMSS